MSVKELKFDNGPFKNKMEVELDTDNNVVIALVTDDGWPSFTLDRNQAHLLMLYLQEHLGQPKLAHLGWWQCSCGKYHPKDYVCERISK